jgi:hypothetical protein
MVRADEDMDGRVLKMISGIVFLGVPHRSNTELDTGSKCAELAEHTTRPAWALWGPTFTNDQVREMGKLVAALARSFEVTSRSRIPIISVAGGPTKRLGLFTSHKVCDCYFFRFPTRMTTLSFNMAYHPFLVQDRSKGV